MKSRISSFRIGKELWKKQIWLFALTCLMFFVLCTISGMVSMNMFVQGEKISLAKMQIEFIALFAPKMNSVGPSAVISLFVVVIIFTGTAAGVNGFSYLHSKTKVDFYHAMPISRTRLYLIQAGICLIDYLVPAIVFINLLLVIGAMRGLTTAAAWIAGWKMILGGLALLLTCYTMACLAMLLTGRLIVGGLGILTFMILGPVMAALKEGWLSSFMITYYNPGNLSSQPLWKYSPYAYPWNALLYMNRKALFISLAAGLILFGINLLIYQKRPSEAAGKSMAFSLPAAVIHIALTIVSSLLIGLFFGTIFSTFSKGWFAFGLIFGCLLAYVIIQMIYTPSFKKLPSGLWKLLVSALVVCLIAGFSLLGLPAYERKLPSQTSIESVGIAVVSPDAYTSSELKPTGMKLPCDSQAYAFLVKLADTYENPDKELPAGEYLNVRIRMTKKNGRNIYRQYYVDSSQIKDEYAGLYAYPDFKKHLYPSLNEDAKSLSSLAFKWGDMTYEIYSDRETDKKKALFQALKDDVQDLDPDAITREIPLGLIECAVHLPDPDYRDDGIMINNIDDYIIIYPSFTRTLAILEKNQKEFPTFLKGIRVIKVYDTEEHDNNGNYKLLATYKNAEEINKVLPTIIPADFDTIWIETDPSRNVEVQCNDDTLVDCRYLAKH